MLAKVDNFLRESDYIHQSSKEKLSEAYSLWGADAEAD